MPIYTRRGDSGKTQVIGSARRFKDDARVHAYGNVDEAGAIVGLALSLLGSDARFQDIRTVLIEVQQTLWDVGADLAHVEDTRHPYRASSVAAQYLQSLIDEIDRDCPPLERFILRGGTLSVASRHWACTVVRRGERDAVHLQQIAAVHPIAVRYLNRLSDLLFVLAGVVTARSGQAEIEHVRNARVFHH